MEMLLICNIYRLKEKKTLLMIINGFIYTFIYKGNLPQKNKKAIHLLDWLIIEGLVISEIVLRKLNLNFSNLTCSLIIYGLKDGAVVEAKSKGWNYLLKLDCYRIILLLRI